MKSVNYPLDLLIVSLAGIYIGHKISQDVFIFGEYIGEPIFWMSISLSTIFFILLFFDRRIFFEWLKSTILFLVMSIIFLIQTPSGAGGCDILGCFGRIEKSQLIALVLLILSVILIIYKHFKLRGKANNPSSNFVH